MSLFDPSARPDPEREQRLRAAASRVEIRPARRRLPLAVRSLACPECEMPLRIGGPVSFSELIACGFCEAVAPGRDFLREQGWPQVQLVARLDTSNS
ncbi:MAG: hypothetical protein M3O25_00035 [Actinomycetota bacterium]|nr:hypothetical protein [Actinomycetota bacterium]